MADQDDIYPDRDEEDEDTAAIRKALEGLDDDDGGDDGGFDQPPVDRASDAPDVISAKDGHDLITEAEAKRDKAAVTLDEHGAKERDRRGKAPEKAEDPREGDAQTDAETKEAGQPDGDEEAEAPKTGDNDLKDADVSDLLDGVPEARKAEVARRLDRADSILRPFSKHANELKMHGIGPEQAINRLLELNSFAQSSPSEYIAWVTKSTADEKAFESAAELLGYKLAKADEGDGDDPFEDESTRKLREENELLKRQLQGDALPFGPDTPQRQAMRAATQTFESIKYERDPETGTLLRPHFEKLEPVIQHLATQQVRQTGRNLNGDDLKALYDDAVKSLGVGAAEQAGTGQDANLAAQDGQAVQKQIETKAASAQRARAASKNIDGSGQGASRRPALPENASLEDTIRHYAAQQE